MKLRMRYCGPVLHLQEGRLSHPREIFLGMRTLILISSGRRKRLVLGFSGWLHVLITGIATRVPAGGGEGGVLPLPLCLCCFSSVLTYFLSFLEPPFVCVLHNSLADPHVLYSLKQPQLCCYLSLTRSKSVIILQRKQSVHVLFRGLMFTCSIWCG